MGISPTPEAPVRRVLVADDEPHIRRVLTTLLEAHGFEVDTARDGLEALELLRSATEYSVILLDLTMPGATGMEVLENLAKLEHRKDIPALVLTAKGQDADRELAFNLGARDFITKPFSPKKLIARIETFFTP